MWTDRTNWLWGALGLGSFAVLLFLEFATETDELTIADMAADALTLFLTIAAAVGCAVLAQKMQLQRQERALLSNELEQARADGAHWRHQMERQFDGIRVAVDAQLLAWGLTNAEQDIGKLILKGLSHKEIALLRGTSVATVRQQAQSIYRKADLPGKSAFSAFFLDDILGEPEPAPTVRQMSDA